MRAPEFPDSATWLNVQRPLSLEELRGHVVLLDFWTYCCINCIHVLPILDKLETTFENEPFQVIGVHAAKFDQEKDPENIAMAIQRHGIRHPVLADSDHEIWQEYTIKAWPTLVLIDSEGKIVDQMSGEPDAASLSGMIRQLLEKDREKGRLAKTRVTFEPATWSSPNKLHFPGKVGFFPKLEDEDHDLLVVSDTGNHRIHLCEWTLGDDGWPRILNRTTVGSGGVGTLDGSFTEASFRRPQGTCRIGKKLYVCDTENHRLRVIDLEEKTVTTAAGSGAATAALPNLPPLKTSLRSPLDCCETENIVLIAMGGAHQIWLYDPTKVEVFPVVGTGREDHIDGGFAECALAQPSSLQRVGVNLIFADSEISSIRIANFEKRKVTTIVGRGLFDFGDRDGKAEETLLQHPLGAVYAENNVYVADTYNNKIKQIDFETQRTETFLGDGSTEYLYEPGGIDAAQDLLIIADTNNHRVRVAKISTQEIKTLELP